MPKTKKRVSRRVKAPTVWQALNEPVAEPTEEFRKIFFPIALFVLAFVWLAPSWNTAPAKAIAYYEPPKQLVSYEGFLGGPKVAVASEQGSVAGTRTINKNNRGEQISLASAIKASAHSAREYYHESIYTPFRTASYEVLDISDPVMDYVNFLRPGMTAVWHTWLELIADPR